MLGQSGDSLPEKKNNEANTHLLFKQGVPGASFDVPEGMLWKVNRILVNNGAYNIIVTSIQYDHILSRGEKIIVPLWCAESNLLDVENNSLLYTFEIQEQKIQ